MICLLGPAILAYIAEICCKSAEIARTCPPIPHHATAISNGARSRHVRRYCLPADAAISRSETDHTRLLGAPLAEIAVQVVQSVASGLLSMTPYGFAVRRLGAAAFDALTPG